MRNARVLTLVTAATVAGAGLAAMPATAHAHARTPAHSGVTTTTTVPYLCPTVWEGQPIVLNYTRDYRATAPERVRPGQAFIVTFDADPINPLPQFNKRVWDVKIVYRLPSNARFAGYYLTGGSNLGGSTQTIVVNGDRIEMKATGPFQAGEDADLPNLNVVLKAPSAGELVTAPAGSSFDDPGFRWTSEDPGTGAVGDLQCYPDPANPVQFSRTLVG